MTSFSRVAAVALLACAPMVAPSAFAQSVEQRDAVHYNAQEVVPEALIGAWKMDPAASHYAGTAPKAHYRIFEYTKDGKLLVHYLTLNANGNQTSGNWIVNVDGSKGVEYTRAYHSTPYAVVTLDMKDAQTFYLTAARFGKVFETGTFKLSSDGNTLTFTYQAQSGTTTVVYHRWDLLD